MHRAMVAALYLIAAAFLIPVDLMHSKPLREKDKAVIDFLEQQTRMNEFLNSVFSTL